jgi:hypothetical protein
MQIEKEMSDLGPALETACEEFCQARATYEVKKLHLKVLKDRRSSLQSVLKSLV